MKGFFIVLMAAVAVSAYPNDSSRIVGGSLTTINQYPDMAAVLLPASAGAFRQQCGGTILNNRSILSAAHCTERLTAAQVRTRLGSTFANSGGMVYNTALVINHHQFNWANLDNDICIIRVQGTIAFNNVVRPGFFAGPNYHVPDNAVVWAAGWGATSTGGAWSEQLRHVQVYTINQAICRQRYGSWQITDNMLCSGVLNVGGRDQCTGDSGGPLYHNGVVVGVCSFGTRCADPHYPGVNARVQRFASWILQNY